MSEQAREKVSAVRRGGMFRAPRKLTTAQRATNIVSQFDDFLLKQNIETATPGFGPRR